MKKRMITIVATGVVAVSVGIGISNDASVDMGKQLFNDTGIGGSTNPKSCGSCHPDGRGLEQASANANLTSMINTCVEGPLKGKALDESSVEMASLKLYIESLKK